MTRLAQQNADAVLIHHARACVAKVAASIGDVAEDTDVNDFTLVAGAILKHAKLTAARIHRPESVPVKEFEELTMHAIALHLHALDMLTDLHRQ